MCIDHALSDTSHMTILYFLCSIMKRSNELDSPDINGCFLLVSCMICADLVFCFFYLLCSLGTVKSVGSWTFVQ
jgi:hypothetical protein